MKIETAEDLIHDLNPGHSVCAPPTSIAYSKDERTMDIACGCGLQFSYAIDYLACRALEEISRKNLTETRTASKKKTGNAAPDRNTTSPGRNVTKAKRSGS